MSANDKALVAARLGLATEDVQTTADLFPELRPARQSIRVVVEGLYIEAPIDPPASELLGALAFAAVLGYWPLPAEVAGPNLTDDGRQRIALVPAELATPETLN